MCKLCIIYFLSHSPPHLSDKGCPATVQPFTLLSGEALEYIGLLAEDCYIAISNYRFFVSRQNGFYNVRKHLESVYCNTCLHYELYHCSVQLYVGYRSRMVNVAKWKMLSYKCACSVKTKWKQLAEPAKPGPQPVRRAVKLALVLLVITCSSAAQRPTLCILLFLS